MASKSGGLQIVGVYGIAHAFVDASCAALVFYASATGRIPPAAAVSAVFVYNTLAFASQPLFGWFVTDVMTARTWARVGAALTAAAFFLSLVQAAFWPAVALAGLGNAIFHLGGGVTSLRFEPGKATLPGIFVAPGAAGLVAGIWMGSNQWAAWLPAAALILLVPLLRAAPSMEVARTDRLRVETGVLGFAIGALFAVVAVRAFIGAGLVLPWKSDPALLWLLTAAVVLGKASGGFLSDRYGRVLVGVGALTVSVPLLVFGPSWAALGIAGMFLFNMTMPVTLVAMADAMPERPGFAFGLTCLGLFVGALPLTLHLVGGLDATVAGVLVLFSAALLWLGLSKRHRIGAATKLLEIGSQEA